MNKITPFGLVGFIPICGPAFISHILILFEVEFNRDFSTLTGAMPNNHLAVLLEGSGIEKRHFLMSLGGLLLLDVGVTAALLVRACDTLCRRDAPPPLPPPPPAAARLATRALRFASLADAAMPRASRLLSLPLVPALEKRRASECCTDFA